MSIYTAHTGSSTLQAYFETGDIPTAGNFIDLIDSLAVYNGTLPYISGSNTGTGSFGNLYVVGHVNSHLIPTANNTYDLGSGSGISWNTAYIRQLSGSGALGNANLTASLNIIPGEDDTYSLGMAGREWKDLHVDGTANLDVVDIDGAVQIDGTVTVGVNDTGKDVKFFGATSGQYLLWDESADELVLTGDSKLSFHDAAGGENIVASANGHLEINAGTTLDITAPTVDVNVSTELNVDGDIDHNGDLNVSGTATIGTLSIANISTGHVSMSGNISGSAASTLLIGGAATVGSLTATSTSITGNITASGNISSSGTITGNKLTIDYVGPGIAATITTASFNYISSSLIPGTDNIFDLGSSTQEWKDLYIDGVAYIDSASLTNTDISKVNSDLIPLVTNVKDLGTSTLQWKDLYVDGVAYIDQISGSGATGDSALSASVHIVPGQDDTYSLGSAGLEWKDLFIDGTANIDAAVIGTLTLTSISSDFDPTATDTYALGSTSKRFTELYTGTINASGISTLTGGVVYGTETKAVGALTPAIPVTFITIDGTKAYSLADGATAGTIKYISVKTVANTPAGTLTPNATAGAWETAAFSVVGQTLTLLWDGAGWAIIGRNSGVAAATGAVAGLPVIA
tara:strand:+ start:57 stop:1949 length:1893 start_codon:yes stop_codon:yes gene_type:complete